MKNYFINAQDIYTGKSNSIFSIGNTGRIVEHKILDRGIFNNLCLFQVDGRGTVIINKTEFYVEYNNNKFYTNPRKVGEINIKRIKNDISNIDNDIKRLYFQKEQLTERLIDEEKINAKNIEIINKFQTDLTDNLKNFIQKMKSNKDKNEE